MRRHWRVRGPLLLRLICKAWAARACIFMQSAQCTVVSALLLKAVTGTVLSLGSHANKVYGPEHEKRWKTWIRTRSISRGLMVCEWSYTRSDRGVTLQDRSKLSSLQPSWPWLSFTYVSQISWHALYIRHSHLLDSCRAVACSVT